MTMTGATRHFLAVGGRRVHYRRQGAGPPLVLLHGSPGNSEMLVAAMAQLGRDFTCFALDSPGFGGSDALPGEVVTIADLADATAAAIAALGLQGVRLFGTHTGAAIGLELGSRHPDSVGGLVLDGVPIFDAAEMASWFEGYFKKMVPDPLGSHFTATWIRFRDQFTWFPWTSRSHLRLNAIDRPPPEAIQLWVTMFFRSHRHYAPAYRSATFYGQGAVRAAAALTVPALFMATAEDMLFAHLDRLPPLRPNQRIAPLPSDVTVKLTTIAAALATLPGIDTLPDTGDALAGDDPALGFVASAVGQIYVRCFGAAGRPALVLLHDAPGSGAALEPRARALAERFRVIVPDLPGCGESAGAGGDDTIRDSVTAVQAIVASLGIERYLIHGRGCGASVAAALAGSGDVRLAAVELDGLPLPDAEIAARIAPDIPLTAEGSHWLTAWLMVRDAQTYWPWYDGRTTAQRHVPGNFDADWLHEQTFEIMKARTSYFRLPRATYRYDPLPALAAATCPVRLVTTDDNPLARHDAVVRAAMRA